MKYAGEVKRFSWSKFIRNSIIILLVFGGIFFCIYRFSPIYTMYKFISALNDKDVDKMVDCVEPKKAEEIKKFMEKFYFISFDYALELIMVEQDASESNDTWSEIRKRDIKIKKIDLNWKEKTASIDFTLKNSDNKVIRMKWDYIWIDGTWYIDSVKIEN